MKTENSATVAIYKSHPEAESAIKELERSGFDLRQLSIVGRDYHTDETVVGFYNAGDRMRYWGRTGAFWGAIWGSLFGSAFFFVPGVGPLLVAGPLVAWIVGALEGAAMVGGLSVVGAGLYGMGIPKNSVLRYEMAIKAGKFVVIAHGTAEETARARATIERTAPEERQDHLLACADPAAINARAKQLWEIAGQPVERDLEFWLRAEIDATRERAESIRVADASPSEADARAGAPDSPVPTPRRRPVRPPASAPPAKLLGP